MRLAIPLQFPRKPRVDPALVPYLQAAEGEAEEALSTLLGGEADRTIRAIVSRTLSGAQRGARPLALDMEDVRADVTVHLLARLRRLKTGDDQAPIENFNAYVASIAYRTCYTHLRRLFPHRARLKNRLRYALANDPDFTIEQDAVGVWRCRLTEWDEIGGVAHDSALVRAASAMDKLRREPAAFALGLVPDSTAARVSISGAMRLLLTEVGAPIELDLMVDAVGGILGVDEGPRLWAPPEDSDEGFEFTDPSAPISEVLIHREYLARLWDEVQELPINQRCAILLNLRDDDGQSALPLLPLTGIASIRAIAEVIGMAAEEFAGLWSRLPLDDAQIARRLALTRQQIINLRKSGRERLGRRMARFGTV